jgi:virginiamycin B lyase
LTGNKIGRITPQGIVTEFPLPNPNSDPEAITSGSGGNLWFTEFPAKIGRIATSGDVTEFPVPTASSIEDAITLGPDGAIWFLQSFDLKFGRITAAGAISTVSGLSSFMAGIASRPDGTLWVAEVGDKIARVTPSGTIAEFAVPPHSGSMRPTGITLGPDGNIWFTEVFGGRIVRASLPPLPVPPLPVPAAPPSIIALICLLLAGSGGFLLRPRNRHLPGCGGSSVS